MKHLYWSSSEVLLFPWRIFPIRYRVEPSFHVEMHTNSSTVNQISWIEIKLVDDALIESWVFYTLKYIIRNFRAPVANFTNSTRHRLIYWCVSGCLIGWRGSVNNSDSCLCLLIEYTIIIQCGTTLFLNRHNIYPYQCVYKLNN